MPFNRTTEAALRAWLRGLGVLFVTALTPRRGSADRRSALGAGSDSRGGDTEQSGSRTGPVATTSSRSS